MELMKSVTRREDFESDLLFHKCARRSEGVDWISQLPDDIIVNILSFLPLKDVAATILISRRWSSLWKYTPNLLFQGFKYKNTFVETRRVNSVLNSHKSPFLKQFTICFYLFDLQVLTRWLQFAFSKRVESLKLDFSCSPSVLGHDILSSIKRSDCRFLRELELAHLAVSGEAIEFFLHNCSSLERLILHEVILKSDIIASGTSLTHFDIDLRKRNGISVEVSCPNLTSFACKYEIVRIFLKNVPNLSHARFFLAHGETIIQFAKEAAKFEFLDVEIIRPQLQSFLVPQMPQLKKLVLGFATMDGNSLLPITDVLQACPCLQEFTIKNKDIGYYMHKFAYASIFEVPKLEKVEHSCLGAFEFEGFCGKIADHMELLMYIVRNCPALERISVVTLPPIAVDERDGFRNCWEFLERNPYHFSKSPHSAVAARQERASALKIKRLTVALLAAKIPHHIKVVVV